MENLDIAVVSPDEAYNRVLSMSLTDACGQIKVTAFTTKQFVLEWSEYDGPGAFYDHFDLILWAGDEIRESYGDNIIYLSDRLSLVSMDYAGSRFSVYRYSPACAIASAIFDIYEHLTGRSVPFVKKDDFKVFAFASYCGGAGCTTLARAVGQELTRFHGKRVMYLSLEDVSSAGEYAFAPAGVKTEGEFLYRLLGRNKLPFLDSYLIKDEYGVCSFVPSKGKNPLRELAEDEMRRTLAALMGSGVFDVIVTDLSTCINGAACAVLESSDGICVVADSPEPGIRENSYMNQLKSTLDDEITKRIIRTENRFLRNREETDAVSQMEGFFGIEVSKLTGTLVNMVK